MFGRVNHVPMVQIAAGIAASVDLPKVHVLTGGGFNSVQHLGLADEPSLRSAPEHVVASMTHAFVCACGSMRQASMEEYRLRLIGLCHSRQAAMFTGRRHEHAYIHVARIPRGCH